MRLNDEAIRKARRPTKGQAMLWDDLLEGFGVRLTPTRAAYVVQWREPGGKRTRLGLRRFWPATATDEARKLAREKLLQVTTPAQGSSGVPLRVAIRDWYEQQTERDAWGARYRVKVSALIRHYIEGEPSPRVKLTPAVRAAVQKIGETRVGEVRRSDVLAVADGLKRGAAEQFMAVLSSFYNFAFERGVEITNPARNRLKVTGGRRIRSRVLTDAELVTIWRELEKEGDPALGAFAMLAFTGARRREATQMRWAEVGLDAMTWTLPPERRKTGRSDPEPFVVNLHPAAVAILGRQPVLEGSPYVFWGRRDRAPFEFHHALMQRLKALGLREWRLHDVRRYVRSGMARLGVTQMVAEMCLGHLTAKGGLVGVYDRHAYVEEKRAAWMKWGDHVAKITNAP